ncbi:hypothetical protein D3C80_2224060 [compost metagenome]
MMSVKKYRPSSSFWFTSSRLWTMKVTGVRIWLPREISARRRSLAASQNSRSVRSSWSTTTSRSKSEK